LAIFQKYIYCYTKGSAAAEKGKFKSLEVNM